MTTLRYVLADGTEVNSWKEAEMSGQQYFRRYREYDYVNAYDDLTNVPVRKVVDLY